MDTDRKTRLLEQFSACLDALPQDDDDTTDEAQHTDQFSLYTELAALKNEVRLESRQVKAALDQVQGVVGTLRSDNQRLGQALDDRRRLEEHARHNAERQLLLEIIELRDRLDSGSASGASWRATGLARLSDRPTQFIAALTEGLRMSLRRIDEVLKAHEVHRIGTTGQVLNPRTMRAVGVEQRAGLAEGAVITELRAGYLQGGDVLRLAEVIVNKPDA